MILQKFICRHIFHRLLLTYYIFKKVEAIISFGMPKGSERFFDFL
jgi:hypothetical protein